MKFKIHQKLQENIVGEQRDIALITAPGMGLSTLLHCIAENKRISVVYIKPEELQSFWDNEFKSRSYNNKFVIHAATVDALIKNQIVNADVDAKRTNLRKFLTENKLSNDSIEKIYIVIDDFDELSEDLEIIVLDELKAISDLKENNEEYVVFNSLRFVIGGCIDFQGLYNENDSGVSPATQFCKHYPDDFLLSQNEVDEILKAEYPEVIKFPFSLYLISEWTNGYLYYVEHLAKWMLEQIEDNSVPSFEFFGSRLQDDIEENKKIPLLKYCNNAWVQIKSDSESKQILCRAVKSPFIREISPQVKKLVKLGLLLEMHTKGGQKHLYKIPNQIIKMFLRQRLAELNLVLHISESPIWWLMNHNVKAYSMLFEIENFVRNYIGDVLVEKSQKNGVNWKEYLSIEFDGKNIRKEAEERRRKDAESIYAVSSGSDPILGFLDFADLAYIIKNYAQDFPVELAEKAPGFLQELNYHRRRIAHNRPMTLELITNIESRWKHIKNLMLKLV
jgi:hypothetical protein